jgi:hypothetical protein
MRHPAHIGVPSLFAQAYPPILVEGSPRIVGFTALAAPPTPVKDVLILAANSWESRPTA